MDWDDEKYMAAKAFWTNFFQGLEPRDDSDEETDAFFNAGYDVFTLSDDEGYDG